MKFVKKNFYVPNFTWNPFLFQNFNICKKCIRLAQLYHKLQHQKHKMFIVCSDVVETRKKNSPELDTTRMLNELLADDSWLETVRNSRFHEKKLRFNDFFSFFSNFVKCRTFGLMLIHLFGNVILHPKKMSFYPKKWYSLIRNMKRRRNKT